MLRLNLQPRTYTYVMNMDMDQAMMGKVNQKMTTTIAVKKSGANYVMTQKITSMKVTADKGSPMAGQAAQLEKAAKGSTTTATYNNRGRLIGNIKSVGSAQATNMLQGMQIGFMGLEFPATAVRPGSSWTASMDLAKMMKSMGGGQVPANVKISGTPLTIKYTVKSLGTNNGKRIANISYTINGTLNMQMPGGQGGMNKNDNEDGRHRIECRRRRHRPTNLLEEQHEHSHGAYEHDYEDERDDEPQVRGSHGYN